jgi:hypothetical protein
MGDLNVNEEHAEQISGEPGSVSAEAIIANSPDPQPEPVTAAAQSVPETSRVESPDLVPEQGGAGETAAVDAPKADAPKTADTAKADAPKAEAPRIPGKIMIMSNDEHAWDNHGVGPEAESEQASGVFGKRRFAALAAVVALAMVAGALGGALATAGLGHFSGGDVATAGNQALEASVARIDADVLVLKTSIDHTSKLGMAQFNKTSERLDKVEKAQAEPAAKLAKLSEAVEKLHAAPPAPVPVAAAAPAAAKEVTGSISAPAATPASAPKVEVARLPTVEGWLLRDVADGGAVIEGRQGIFEVYAGDLIPGLGRVDAVRRQDGRWVVVTSRGLIVAR